MDIQASYTALSTYTTHSERDKDAIGKTHTENSHFSQISESEASKQQIIRELSARDREVRAHEQAHKAVAGQLSQGAPSYTYQRGPNGQLYAVGGEVQIDTSPVKGDPQATIQKAEQIKRAALAPANPSAQDRSVAAQATQMAAQARAELQAQSSQENDYEENNTAIKSDELQGTCAVCGGSHSADTHILIGSLTSNY